MKQHSFNAKYSPFLPLLSCPICGNGFSLSGMSLICENGHCFDGSKKGYLNLAPLHNNHNDLYDTDLFSARSIVFSGGFYRILLDKLIDILRRRFQGKSFTLFDIGCGEGYYSRSLSEEFPESMFLGGDLSRDAILKAASVTSSAGWMIADLKHLPFRNHSLDVLLDILTPADYMEFSRVTTQNGIFLKVIPGNRYLTEIRSAVSPYLRDAGSYSDERVENHLRKNAEILQTETVYQVFSLTEEQSEAFLTMTPLTSSIQKEKLSTISLSQITIDLRIFLCSLV